jgi:hypothetical protein
MPAPSRARPDNKGNIHRTEQTVNDHGYFDSFEKMKIWRRPELSEKGIGVITSGCRADQKNRERDDKTR